MNTMEKITINKGKLLAAYREANEDQQVILEFLYGKETFQYDWREITSYEKACEVLGIEQIEFKEFGDRPQYMRMANAMQKILVICEAINGNGNWYDKNGYSYYPIFVFYTNEEIKDISEEQYKKLRIRRISSLDHTNGDKIYGVGYDLFVSKFNTPYVDIDYGMQLCLNTREKAEFVGEQFFELYCQCNGYNPQMH